MITKSNIGKSVKNNVKKINAKITVINLDVLNI